MAPKRKVTKTTPKTAPKTASASKTTPSPRTTARRTPTTRRAASAKTTPPPASPETTTNIPETAISPPKTTSPPASTQTVSPETAPSPKPASPEPATIPKPASPEPATSSKIAAPEPATSPKTSTPEAATTPKTAAPEPAATPKTAAPGPPTSPKSSAPEPATSPKTIPSETATSPKTTSVTAQIVTGTASASAEGTETAANTTNAPKTAPKTIIKVKKKIVKRKVIKRVKPKKEEAEEKPQLPVEDEKPNPNPDQAVKIENPSSDVSKTAVKIENPSSDVSETAADQSSNHPEQLDSRNLDSENPEAMETDDKKGGEEEDENERSCEEAPTGEEKNENEKRCEEVPTAEEKNENEREGEGGAVGEEAVRLSERQQRRKTEIFIGGLDRDAKEEDIKKVFEKIGEVIEIRLMMNNQTGKNKGYAFLRYASPADAKRAITELAKVEICGKQCGAVAAEGNDTIFLGNIDKKWKKEDVMKLLQEIGIENIDTVTVIPDHNNPDCNRGFAFLELETNKDAQIAYKKLQKKDVLGKNRNIKVSWAEPLNEPDEEELLKVKSVYAEGIPASWDEEKVRKHFKKFGDIERVALSRNILFLKSPSGNIQSARREFAIVNFKTRESAITCIESFKTEELIDEGSKLDVKVSLAKPIPKAKHSKGGSKSVQDHSKEKVDTVNRGAKTNVPANKGKSVSYPVSSGVDKRSSTTHELLQVLRQQAAWGEGYMGLAKGSAYQDYVHAIPGGKRPVAALGDAVMYSDPRGYPRARLDSSFPVANSSYSTLSHRMSGTSLPYYQQPGAGYAAGITYGTSGHPSSLQTRQGAAPYGRGQYHRD